MKKEQELSYDDARALARYELSQLFSLHGLDARVRELDGSRMDRWALVWRTGIVITDPAGIEWKPSPSTIEPGSHFYRCAEEAESNSRLFYTAAHDEHISRMIEQSGNRKAAYQACVTLLSKLMIQGSPTPKDLAAWGDKHLREEIREPRKPGGIDGRHTIREKCTVLAVSRLVSLGVTATQSQASSHNESACYIVSDVMSEDFDYPTGYESVRKAYQRFLKQEKMRCR